MNLLFASNNAGKLKEVQPLGKKFGIDVISPNDAGVSSNPEESGETFEANALIKLNDMLSKVSDIDVWVAAEDSGLKIDYLDGLPGVRTRRWAGHEMTDQEIVDYTLQQLEKVPYEQRQATFHSVVALARSTDPGTVKYYEGIVEGHILQHADTRQPMNGLPFRQLFYIPEISRMLGDTEDLDAATAQIYQTHRQRSFTKLFKYLKDLSQIV